MLEWVVSMCLRREEVRSEANWGLTAAAGEVGVAAHLGDGMVGQAGRLAKCWVWTWDIECWHAAGFRRAKAAPISARSFPITPQCEGPFACACESRGQHVRGEDHGCIVAEGRVSSRSVSRASGVQIGEGRGRQGCL